jgi:RHS repeat-associated protein
MLSDGLNFIYDGSGRITQAAGPDGAIVTYAYDGPGSILTSGQAPADNLTRVTYPDGTSRTYGYNEPGHTGNYSPNTLTSITDENGIRYVTYTYDAQGRAIDEIFPAVGVNTNRYQLTFGSNSTTVTDPLGTRRTYTFQTIQGVTRSTGQSQPGGSGCGPAGTAFTYDSNGNVASRTDFNGNVTTYAYDLTRNLETRRIEASGKPEARTITTQWHPYWRQPAKIAEPKKRTTWTYNGDNNLYCAPQSATVPNLDGGTRPIGVICSRTEQTTTDATGSQGLNATATGTARTWTWTYNPYGQMLTANGPRTDVADVTTYTYYSPTDPDLGKRGQIATVTNALGHVTTLTAYDGNGNPLTVTDPNGVTTTFTYDLRQRLTSRRIGNETTTYTYDPVGQLTQVTLPDGSVTAYTYDAAHRLTGINDALGNRITYTLDAIGNRIKEDVQDPAGQPARTRSRIVDALNRLAQDIGSQGQTTTYQYDANGNRTRVTDPLNHSTVSHYDALNRLIGVTDPGQGQTTYGYDSQDQPIAVTDPRNLVTAYLINGLGNTTAESSPDTGLTTWTYDAAGNETSRLDARGQIASTAWDALNRPTRRSYNDGNAVILTWDQGINGKGRLTQLEERSGSTVTGRLQYAYDPQGRITRQTRTLGNLSHSTAYAYSNGQLAALTLPSGKQLRFTRNGAGQITQIDLIDNGQTRPLIRAIAYHPFGGIKHYTDSAGQTHTRDSDLDGRTRSYTLGSTPWQLSYDSAGRIIAQMDTTNAAHSAAYGYDAQDRLTNASLPNASYGYGYDANGNRVTQSAGGNTRNNNIDGNSNRLNSLTNPSQTFTHDLAGNRIGDAAAAYTHDARGRLVKTVSAAGTTAYQIDALGQRIRKTLTQGSATVSDTIFHYDLAGHLIGESNGAGQVQREYVWLEDTPVVVVDTVAGSTRIRNLHADHLNTPRLATDEQCKIIWRNSPLTEPFGNSPPEEDPDGDGIPFTLNLRFPGQYFDRETNLHYNYFRDYDPLTGRYVQADPIGLAGGGNLFGYANQSPLSYIDSDGLNPAVYLCVVCPECCVVAAAGAIIWGICENRAKNPPDIGPPNGWIQGPRRGRKYGPDGLPEYDIDKPHQGNNQDHVHEWPDGQREEPGRPVSPVPQSGR